MPSPDPRQIAAAVGHLTGNDDLAQTMLSGRLSSNECVPLLAGLIDGVVRTLLLPLVGGSWGPFRPGARPMVASVTLLDGSRIRVTLEPEL